MKNPYDDQLDQIRKAPIGQFLTDPVGKLEGLDVDLVAGTSTCLRVRVGPFGYEKSAELTTTTNRCACVAVLMAMPEELRMNVDTIDMEIPIAYTFHHGDTNCIHNDAKIESLFTR